MIKRTIGIAILLLVLVAWALTQSLRWAKCSVNLAQLQVNVVPSIQLNRAESTFAFATASGHICVV